MKTRSNIHQHWTFLNCKTTIMNENQRDPIIEDQDQSDEPRIFSLEAYRLANQRPDDHPPEPTEAAEAADPTKTEAFWAGRNHAMRRSARWAA